MSNIKKLKVRIMSIITALMIAGTPVLGNASNSNSDKKASSSFSLMKKNRTPNLTFEDYAKGVEKAYYEAMKYSDSYASNEEFQFDVQELYYLMSRAFVTKDLEKELSDYVDVNKDDVERFVNAERLLKEVYLKDASNLKNDDEIFDLSKFCFNENDADIVKSMRIYLEKVYENGEWNDDALTELFKTLTTLNVNEGRLNADALSVGSKTFVSRDFGEMTMYATRSRMVDKYLKDLPKYYEEIDFAKELLNREAWKLRDDVVFDYNCLTDLERLITMHLQLEEFCVKNVYNDFLSAYAGFEYGERTYNDSSSLTFDDFSKISKEAYDEVCRHLNFGVTDEANNRLEQAVSCVSYFANIEMPKEVEDKLLDDGIIFQTENGNPDFYTNIMPALELGDLINDQIQSRIKYTQNVNDIVNLGKFLVNKEAASLVEELLGHLVNSYNIVGKEEVFNEEEFQKLFEGVMKINPDDGHVGLNYITEVHLIPSVKQVLQFYFENDYLRKGNDEIYIYFDRVALNGAQWKLKDVDFNTIKDSKLKKYVEIYKVLNDRFTNGVSKIMEYLSVKVNNNGNTR